MSVFNNILSVFISAVFFVIELKNNRSPEVNNRICFNLTQDLRAVGAVKKLKNN